MLFVSFSSPFPRRRAFFSAFREFREDASVGTHRTREPRGEELRLGWELGELGDVATQRPAGEVVLEHLSRARFVCRGPSGEVSVASEAIVARFANEESHDRGSSVTSLTGRTRLYAVWVVLHLENDLVPRVLQTEIQPADPGEQRDRLHGRGPARSGVTRTTDFGEKK